MPLSTFSKLMFNVQTYQNQPCKTRNMKNNSEIIGHVDRLEKFLSDKMQTCTCIQNTPPKKLIHNRYKLNISFHLLIFSPRVHAHSSSTSLTSQRQRLGYRPFDLYRTNIG